MKKSLKNVNYLLITCVIALAVICLWLRQITRQEKQEVSNDGGTIPVENVITKEGGDEEVAVETNPALAQMQKEDDPRKERTKRKQAEEQAIKDEIQQLLDDEDTHGEAMEKALKALTNGNAEVRRAALRVFEWVGGEESVKALIPLLSENSEVGRDAENVLSHLIQQNIIDETPLMTPEIWFDLIHALPNSENIDQYMVYLISYPVEQAAPALLELLKTDNESIRLTALEYFGHIANGVEIADKKQAEAWYLAYQKEQSAQEKKEP